MDWKSEKMDSFLQILLNAIFTGFGVAIGSYIAQKHLIEKMEKLVKEVVKLKRKVKGRVEK
jgi:uncharacterized protein YneF (UPF0154 family)